MSRSRRTRHFTIVSPTEMIGPQPVRAVAAEIRFSAFEEFLHSLTHGIGLLLSIAALVLMILVAGENAWKIVAASLFGAALINLYAASTLYHAVSSALPRLKEVLRVIDHIGIYGLILGTYVPFALIPLRGPWGWSILGVVAALALIGTVSKIVFRKGWNVLSLVLYLGMGWLSLVTIVPMAKALPLPGLLWLVAGGVTYSLGTIFFAWKSLKYHHLIWHVFVLAGSVCHFCAVYFYVL